MRDPLSSKDTPPNREKGTNHLDISGGSLYNPIGCSTEESIICLKKSLSLRTVARPFHQDTGPSLSGRGRLVQKTPPPTEGSLCRRVQCRRRTKTDYEGKNSNYIHSKSSFLMRLKGATRPFGKGVVAGGESQFGRGLIYRCTSSIWAAKNQGEYPLPLEEAFKLCFLTLERRRIGRLQIRNARPTEIRWVPNTSDVGTDRYWRREHDC